MNEATRDLGRAVDAKDLAAIDAALARGAHINAWGGEGTPMNALQKAAYIGYEEGFARLLERGADLHDKAGRQYSATALSLFSTNSSHTLTTRALQAGGADPHWRDLAGGSMLHLAAANSIAENVRLLLQAGLDPCAQDKQGMLPLHVAVSSYGKGKLELLTVLAAATPDLEAAFPLAEGGRRTALEQAFLRESHEALSCLLALGARPELRLAPDGSYDDTDSSSRQALSRSERRRTLLRLRLSYSPLENAVLTGSPELVLLCLERQPRMEQAQVDAAMRRADKGNQHDIAGVIRSWAARQEAASALSGLLSHQAAP